MKGLKSHLQYCVFLLLILFARLSAFAQITPSQDAYINTATAATNYGTAATLGIVSSASSIQTTYVKFDLSSVPSGYTSANVAKATLKLYVNSVTTAGSFNVDVVNGTWSEKTITADLLPALGTTVKGSVPLTTANANTYLMIDLTATVGQWLSGSLANDGIALVPNSPLSATFQSKENTAQSHPAELDVVFTNGATLKGVTTATGSGLAGGGTSGTLSLSLTKSCTTSQVLQWNGSAWVCAAMSTGAGTGTITGVKAGTGLTGGGTSGAITLNLDTTKVPLLATANTFTGNQTVNGNLSAAGMVTGSGFQIGSNLFAFGSTTTANVFLGFAGNGTMTGTANTATGPSALQQNTTGFSNTASGASALSANTSGNQNTAVGSNALLFNTTGYDNTAIGNMALFSNTTAVGNTASGQGALWVNTTGYYNTASGTSALSSNTTGSNNTATGFQALAANTSGISNTASGDFAGATVDGSN